MTAPRIVETHVSTLFFAGDRVYKLKKPVRTAFVDFGTVAARGAACRREVELNRRLAPDVYLGVADVTMAGEEVDHVVVMRRLPEDRRLSARLDAPTVDADLRGLAHLIATFHSTAARSDAVDAASGPDALAALWATGVEQLAPFVPAVLDAEEVAVVGRRAAAYLAGRGPLIEERIAGGRACDGHGDLQAEDIFVLDDGPRVLDCLEFDDRLRYGDVLADVAFLAMDLQRLGHPGLGAAFLDHYAELAADHWPASLVHLHVAYRAHVRAKVACLRHDQGDPDAASAARALHRLAADHLDAGRVRLVVVGGAPGTGKSSLAAALADRVGAVVVSTDRVRDALVPRDGGPSDRLGEGRYRPDLVDAVYDEVLRRAGVLLERGESVVVDGSWTDPRHRDDARRVATATTSELVELRCECPEEVAAARVERRLAAGSDPSEATAEVARALAAAAAPWPEATPVGTAGPAGVAVDRADEVVRGVAS